MYSPPAIGATAVAKRRALTGIFVRSSTSGIWSYGSFLEKAMSSIFSDWSCEDGADERYSGDIGEQHVGGRDSDDAIQEGEAIVFMLSIDGLFLAGNFIFCSY